MGNGCTRSYDINDSDVPGTVDNESGVQSTLFTVTRPSYIVLETANSSRRRLILTKMNTLALTPTHPGCVLISERQLASLRIDTTLPINWSVKYNHYYRVPKRSNVTGPITDPDAEAEDSGSTQVERYDESIKSFSPLPIISKLGRISALQSCTPISHVRSVHRLQLEQRVEKNIAVERNESSGSITSIQSINSMVSHQTYINHTKFEKTFVESEGSAKKPRSLLHMCLRVVCNDLDYFLYDDGKEEDDEMIFKISDMHLNGSNKILQQSPFLKHKLPSFDNLPSNLASTLFKLLVKHKLLTNYILLKFSNCSITKVKLCNYPAVTDVWLTGITNLCNVQHLDLSNCRELTDDAFILLEGYAKSSKTSMRFPMLLLNISHCSKLTDASVSNVIFSFSGTLIRLDISYCYRLTDETLSKIIACKNLTHFNCERVKNFSTAFLCQLSLLRKIRCLKMNMCPNVNDKVVQALAIYDDLSSVLDLAVQSFPKFPNNSNTRRSNSKPMYSLEREHSDLALDHETLLSLDNQSRLSVLEKSLERNLGLSRLQSLSDGNLRVDSLKDSGFIARFSNFQPKLFHKLKKGTHSSLRNSLFRPKLIDAHKYPNTFDIYREGRPRLSDDESSDVQGDSSSIKKSRGSYSTVDSMKSSLGSGYSESSSVESRTEPETEDGLVGVDFGRNTTELPFGSKTLPEGSPSAFETRKSYLQRKNMSEEVQEPKHADTTGKLLLLGYKTGLKNLKHLEVGWTAVKDVACECFSSFKKLKYLDISSCRISRLGVESLSKATSIKVLKADYCDNLGLDLSRLSNLKKLTTLSLNYIKPPISLPLGQLNLTELNLCNTEIGDTTVEALLSGPVMLRQLNLEACRITERTMKVLSNQIKLESLVLNDNVLVNNMNLKHLKNLTSLKHLSLYNTAVSDAGINGTVIYLFNLESLVLDGVNIDNDSLKYLYFLTKLKRLDLFGTRISNSGLKYIRKLSNHLEELLICGTATYVTSEGLEHIGHLKKLKKLNISQNTNITDSGVLTLSNTLHHTLKSLNISNTGVTRNGILHLKNMVQLEELNIRGLHFDSGVAELIAELQKLWRVLA